MRQPSHTRLLVSILLPLWIVIAVAAAACYVITERAAGRLTDKTLHAVAMTVARDLALSEDEVLAKDLLDSMTKALGDPVFYRATDPDGRFVGGYFNSPTPRLPLAAATKQPQFYDADFRGATVRALVFREYIVAVRPAPQSQLSGWVTIQVWQTVLGRAAYRQRLMRLTVTIATVTAAAAAAAVWFGINLGLRRPQRSISRLPAPNLSSIQVEQLATAAAARNASAINRRGVTIDVQVEGEPAPIRADADLLGDALDELLDNALRYGCGDGSTIDIRVKHRPGYVRLAVSDQGPGVPAEQCAALLPMSGPSATNATRSSNRGLQIVRAAAERHGGALHLAETPSGACFEITLPREGFIIET